MDDGAENHFLGLTYPHPFVTDHTLNDNLPTPGETQPFISSNRPPPATSVGALDWLPPELVQEILLYLDLRSLTNVRRVNRRALDFVESLPQIKAVMAHAHDALRGILLIGTGGWITCRELYEKLCTFECERCGDFGGYLYLLTCRRVCFLCLSEEPSFLPLTPTRAIRKLGLNRQIIETLPRMKVIPGIYSPNEKKAARSVLVDYDSALNAAVRYHGSIDTMRAYVSRRETQDLEAYHERLAVSRDSPSTRARRHRPRTTDPFDGQSGNPLRFVASSCTPWFDKKAQEVHWGFHCIGCEKSKERPLHWRQKYTPESFQNHLERFGDIRDAEHVGKERV